MKKILLSLVVLLVMLLCILFWCFVRMKTLDDAVWEQRASSAASRLHVLYLLRDANIPSNVQRPVKMLTIASLDRLNNVCLASESAAEKVLDSPLIQEAVAYGLNVVGEKTELCSLPLGGTGLPTIKERIVLFKELRSLLGRTRAR